MPTVQGDRCKPCAKQSIRSSGDQTAGFPLLPILGGLGTSAVAWLMAPYLAIFPFAGIVVAFLIGMAVAQVTAVLAEGHRSLLLIASAVVNVALGCVLVNLVLLVWAAQQVHLPGSKFSASTMQSLVVLSLIRSAVSAFAAFMWMSRVRI